jgi:hypothetical protein
MSTAKKAKENADAKTAVTEKPAKKPPTDSAYSAAELANAARVRFKVPPEVVQVALKLAGKTEATLEETQKILKEFMERKVKR